MPVNLRKFLISVSYFIIPFKFLFCAPVIISWSQTEVHRLTGKKYHSSSEEINYEKYTNHIDL